MGSTFVTLGRDVRGNRTSDRDRHVGFWMRDDTLEVWLRLLALHIGEPESHDDPAYTIRNQFLLASALHFNGCVPHELEKATEDAAGFAVVSRAAHALSDTLAQCPVELCGKTLTLLNCPTAWRAIIPTDMFREIATAFIRLLNFETTSTANTPGAMVPSFPTLAESSS